MKAIIIMAALSLGSTTLLAQANEPIKPPVRTSPQSSASVSSSKATITAGTPCDVSCLFAGASIGYLKISDISGESTRARHEKEIDIYSFSWSSAQASGSSVGSGRARGRSVAGALRIGKRIDRASPYLALAEMQGKSFDEVVLTLKKSNGGTEFDYLIVRLENVIISNYEVLVDGESREFASFSFEKIHIKYVEQAPDGFSGDEHEVEYDVVAGM